MNLHVSICKAIKLKYLNRRISLIVVYICCNTLNHSLRYVHLFFFFLYIQYFGTTYNTNAYFYLQDPIKDYLLPIKQLVNWFDALVVTKKREDIVNLIKKKMAENNRNIILPEIQLPTEDGKLLELPDFTEEHGEFEEEEELDNEIPEVN